MFSFGLFPRRLGGNHKICAASINLGSKPAASRIAFPAASIPSFAKIFIILKTFQLH